MKKASTAYNRFFSWPMLSGLVGLAGVIAMLVLNLINEYRDVERHAQIEVENISRLLEEHALATIHKSDLLLREIQRNVHPGDMNLTHGINASRKMELHKLLKSQLESVQEVAVIHITDAKGNHIYSSLDQVPHINVADRYHFTHNRDNPAAGLVISPPNISRTTGKWTMVLSRRLNFEDGSFAGIINVLLNLEYFQQFYRTLDLGPHGQVALYDEERHLVARFPPSEKSMGKVISIQAKTYIEKGVKHLTYYAKSPLDGIERLTSFRQVGNLPLFVFAGIAEDDYLAEWRRHIWQYAVGVIILGFMVIGFSLRQRRTEESLRESEERFSLFMNTLPAAAFIKGNDGTVLYANRYMEEVLGTRAWRGKTTRDLFSPELAEEMIADDRRALDQEEVVTEEKVPCTDGQLRLYQTHKFRIPRQGQPPLLGGIAQDITERKQLEEKIWNLAYFDPLTNLPNRRMLLDHLAHGLSQAKRYERSLAVMFLDLDNFKKINDTFGHDIGDELLKEVSVRLSTCVRTGDTVSRTGGDEFIIVLAEITHPDDAALVADKIIKTINVPIQIGDNTLNVSTSIGISVYPINGSDDAMELMKKADKAMYAAKAAGRNGYRFFAD